MATSYLFSKVRISPDLRFRPGIVFFFPMKVMPFTGSLSAIRNLSHLEFSLPAPPTGQAPRLIALHPETAVSSLVPI